MIRQIFMAIAIAAIFPAIATAQLPSAELHSIDPPVIEAGKTTEVTLTGINLDESNQLFFSDPAVKFEPTQQDLRFKITVPKSNGQKTITVRSAGYFGLSTSRPLVILPAGTSNISDAAGAKHHQIETAPALPLETIGYGTTDAKQIDWWKVNLEKGQRILIHCKAERIDSLADPVLTIVDRRGYELERNRDSVGRDPMLDFTPSKDGPYWVGVSDTFFNGGSNFQYIIEASTRPWIDGVFPPAGIAGQAFEAVLIGRNLPGGSLGENLSIEGKPVETLKTIITVPSTPATIEFNPESPAKSLVPTFPFRYNQSNLVQLGFSEQPVITTSSNLTPPFEVAGKFISPTEPFKFRFSSKKQATYYVEVIADRIAGHIDPYVVVEQITRSKNGSETLKKIRDGDDCANTAGNTFNHSSRDVILDFGGVQNGEYQISVFNQYSTSGPEKIFRLTVREAKPDFDILAILERPYLDQRQAYPAPPLLRKGGTFPFRLTLKRKDGFKGPVTVTAADLPPDVVCPPVTLSEKESTGYLVFAATPDAKPWNGIVKVVATAKSGDTEITHPVRTGTLVNGVSDYNTGRLRARLDSDFPLSVSASETTPARLEIPNDGSFSVTLGKKLEIPIQIPTKHNLKGNLTITPVGLPGMRKPPTTTISDKADSGKLTIYFTSKKNIFTPTAGNWTFVLKGTGVTKYARNPQALERAESKKKQLETRLKQYTEAEKDEKAKTEKEKAILDKEIANLKKTSASKDVKFATWSLPLTVEVKPAEKTGK